MGFFQIGLWTRQNLFWSSELWYWSWHFSRLSQPWIPQLMVPEDKAAHSLHVCKYQVCQGVSLCWPFYQPRQEVTIPALQRPPRLLVSCCVVSSRYRGGWSLPWVPGHANTRLLPAVCRRLHLFFPVSLAVAGTPLKNTHVFIPTNPNLQVLSCLIIHPRAELCASLLLSDRTPSIPLDDPSWRAPIHPWQRSSQRSGSAQIYACVNTNMLLNNWVVPRAKAP